MKDNLEKLHNSIQRRSRYRTVLLSLAIVVVFVTTYLLILPAITLDQNEAERQGGIDVPSVTQTAATDNDADIADNSEQGIYSYLRMSEDEVLVIIMNTDVQAFSEYSIGVPEYAFYKELISSDDAKYAGSGICNTRQVRARKKPMHGMPYSITIKVPAVGGCILQMKRKIK